MDKYKVYLPISKISEFCGSNRYVPKQESFFNTFKKNEPVLYEKILKKINKIDKNIQNKDIIKELKLDEKIEESIEKADTRTTNKNLKEIEKIIISDLTNKSVSEEIKKVVANNVREQSRKMINTEIGTRNEETSLNNIEILKNMNITERNVKLYTGFIETENVNCKICGRIDGIDEENKTIIEHKQRVNHLFDTIPPYEIIQIYMYMYITDNNSAKLVQTYKDQIKILELEWYDERWDIIINKFRKSLEEYFVIVTNSNKLEKLVRKYTVEKITSEKNNSISNYFTMK